MELFDLLNKNTASYIKIEVSLEDLKRFAEILIEQATNTPSKIKEEEDIGGIELAVRITGLSKSTIYTKVSKNLMPFMKQKKTGRLFFSKSDLLNWIRSGKVDTIDEINNNIHKFLK